jgi:hypothetical protein
MKNDELNKELFEKYKDLPRIAELYKFHTMGAKKALRQLNYELKELQLLDIFTEAVEFEKKLPKDIGDRQRISMTYYFIQLGLDAQIKKEYACFDEAIKYDTPRFRDEKGVSKTIMMSSKLFDEEGE